MSWIEVWLSCDFIQARPGESSSWINASNSRYNGQKVNGKVVTVLQFENQETLISLSKATSSCRAAVCYVPFVR